MTSKKKKLAELKAELDSIIVALPEIKFVNEIQYQVDRLKKVSDEIEPLIHGSGTGED